MLTTLMIINGVLILGGLIYLSTLDGNYTVRRSRLINADINTVFDKLRDFKSWPEWSPWLLHEPDCALEYSDNITEEGGHYSWDGKYIGAGKLTHIKQERPTRLQEKIEFTRPFKSVCDVDFELEDKDSKTEVTWTMNGKMPFLFRFMVPRTVDMISKDYDLGLAMLGGRLDPSSEYPRLSFEGEDTREEQYSLIKHFDGYLPEMEKAMQAGFPELVEHIQAQGQQPASMPFTVYNKVDLKKMHFDCDMAIPLSEDMNNVGDFNTKLIDGGRYYKTTLHGAYHFLELAWYASYAHLYMHKIKFDKNRPSIEVYENDPQQVEHSNDILTSIYIPIK